MSTTVVIAISILVLMAYAFDLTSKHTKIPTVILLIILGWGVQQLSTAFNVGLPGLKPLLPILGSVGLILIVLEAGLDLELNKSKKELIAKSAMSAIVPLVFLFIILGVSFSYFGETSLINGFVNALPLCVISSAIAIPSVQNLDKDQKEFVIYESSFSDIFGVIIFNFFIANEVINLAGVSDFILQIVIILVISLIASVGLAFLIKRIDHHVKFIPIIMMMILVYDIAKVFHLPALIFIMIFGLLLNNLDELKRFKFIQKLDVEKLDKEVLRFREIVTEITFLVRTMFFLLFGFTINTSDLLNPTGLLIALGIITLILTIRFVYLKASGMAQQMQFLFIAPRGLITILLFISIPESKQIPFVNESLMIQVVLLSAIVMMLGLMFNRQLILFLNKGKLPVILLLLSLSTAYASSNSFSTQDSITKDSLRKSAESLLLQNQQQKHLDSLIRTELEKELVKSSGDLKKAKELEERLRTITSKDSLLEIERLIKIQELKKSAINYAVAPFKDTLFYISTQIGSFSAKERAKAIEERIKLLYNTPAYNKDSLKIIETETSYDIIYKNETLILSVTNLDGLWIGKNNKEVANEYLNIIKKNIGLEKDENSISNWLQRIGMVLLIMLALWGIVFLINKGFKKSALFIKENKDKYFKGLSFKNIKLLTENQLIEIAMRLNNILKVVVILLVIYLSLPLLFSIFPETKNWTDTLLNWILTPAKSVLFNILNFLPNLFTIIVIFFAFKYAIRGLKYIVDEIEKGNLSLTDFHPDWAQPTFNIVKFLLYAFMVVLIFPYLPGSGSAAFQGVSVFVGILFSLGSSNAIANMVAGLVITYMRPFKIGDRIKIGDIKGDVIEKTMLVTRIRTIKNEDITIPNSTVLSGSTTNYSSNTKAQDQGLIVHTTVTIGYDIPWKQMQETLIKAALQTDMILNEPKPFVLQTSLDDFYVSYQLNAYTKEASKQALIYSLLHQNIQDCCNESGIEILSPHYRGLRDGNTTTIPSNYLDKNYKAPAFNINNSNINTEESK